MLKDTRGIMEQIRAHLGQGKSSRELIDMGFAPGTVFKVQRQVRKNSPAPQREPVQATALSDPRPSGPEDPEWWPSLDDLLEQDDALALYHLLNHDFASLGDKVEVLSDRLDQLSQIHARIKKLEAENHDLLHRLMILEAGAIAIRRFEAQKPNILAMLKDRELWK